MIVYAGKIPSQEFSSDVWVLQGANGAGGTPTWTQLAPAGPAPPARHMHSMVYDRKNNRMVVFGGHILGGTPFANDLWVLQNANGLGGTPAWGALSPAGTAPAAREWHTAVLDEINNRMIVFGGTKGGLLNDVWVLDHANGLGGMPSWILLNPKGTVPAARAGHTAVYDGANNRMIVFGGGHGGGGPFYDDVWVLEHANGMGGTSAWIALSPTGTPPSVREDHVAIYDPGSNRMVVFGGWDGPNYFNDVWVLEKANGLGGTPKWLTVTPSGTPPSKRELASAVYDDVCHRMILFGGSYSGEPICNSGSCTNDVWVLKHVP